MSDSVAKLVDLSYRLHIVSNVVQSIQSFNEVGTSAKYSRYLGKIVSSYLCISSYSATYSGTPHRSIPSPTQVRDHGPSSQSTAGNDRCHY